MERTPQPPHDPEVRSKIDKIASFVAKAGPQAEERLRADHNGKPQFAYLFGGEYSDYYRFALQCEIYNMNQGLPSGSRPPPKAPAHTDVEQTSSFDYAAAQERIDQLRQEIVNSEMNLKAHFEAIPLLKEAEFAGAVAEAEQGKTIAYLERVGLDVSGLDELLEQLHNKCSKDVVSSMKKWIFDYCTTDQLREVILMYLLGRVRAATSSESFRLHVLYLINDWAYYCNRKKLDGVRQMLSRYVPQLYAFAADNVKDPSIEQKLEKLVGTWEGSKYFDDNCFKQLRNTSTIIHNYKTQTQAEHQKLGTEIHNRLLSTYAGYEKQHNDFATHMSNQITAIEAQIEMERSKAEAAHRKSIPSLMTGSRRSRFDCGPPAGEYGSFFDAPPGAAVPPGGSGQWNADDSTSKSSISYGGIEEDLDGEPIDMNVSSSISSTDIDESSLIPRAPFYDLPAAVIMGQIKIEDLTYKPIEVCRLRMPPALPPTPRLLMAMEAFYAPANIDRPRDSQGWEKDGLVEFYDRKSRLKKVLEETQCVNGKTFEDLISNRLSATELEEEREEREEARKKRIEESSIRRSRSPSPSIGGKQRRSRSGSRSDRSNSRSPRRSRKRSKSTSSSPRRRYSSSSSSSSRSPEGRPSFGRRSSPSPPRFAVPHIRPHTGPLGADNKGAQLMAKMGWQGKGLGSNEHGIQEPISGGEIRARDEQFKGLGHKTDEFAEYRRQRASAYSDRMMNRL